MTSKSLQIKRVPKKINNLLLKYTVPNIVNEFVQEHGWNTSTKVASSFLDNWAFRNLKSITDELSEFDPHLKRMLEGNGGVRKWEYGMMLQSCPPFQDKQVLDVGSGPSMLPLFLAKRKGAQVTVLDLPKPFTIEFEEMSRRLLNDNVILRSGDMRNMPFEDNSFDFVISVSVIEHLSHSPDHKSFFPKDVFVEETRKTLTEMYRVLKPGGWIYLTTDAYIPGRVKTDAWGKKLLDGNPFGAYPVNELDRKSVV